MYFGYIRYNRKFMYDINGNITNGTDGSNDYWYADGYANELAMTEYYNYHNTTLLFGNTSSTLVQ